MNDELPDFNPPAMVRCPPNVACVLLVRDPTTGRSSRYSPRSPAVPYDSVQLALEFAETRLIRPLRLHWLVRDASVPDETAQPLAGFTVVTA